MSIHDMNKFVVVPGILQDATDDLDAFSLFKMVEKGARMLSQRKNSFTPKRRMVTLEDGLVSGIDYIKNYLKKVFSGEIDEALAVSDCNLLLARLKNARIQSQLKTIRDYLLNGLISDLYVFLIDALNILRIVL